MRDTKIIALKKFAETCSGIDTMVTNKLLEILDIIDNETELKELCALFLDGKERYNNMVGNIDAMKECIKGISLISQGCEAITAAVEKIKES